MKATVWTPCLLSFFVGFYVMADGATLPRAMTVADPVTAFLDHPERCADLLGQDRDGDIPPPDFHVALEAVLDASEQPAARAIIALSQRCKQRLG